MVTAQRLPENLTILVDLTLLSSVTVPLVAMFTRRLNTVRAMLLPRWVTLAVPASLLVLILLSGLVLLGRPEELGLPLWGVLRRLLDLGTLGTPQLKVVSPLFLIKLWKKNRS